MLVKSLPGAGYCRFNTISPASWRFNLRFLCRRPAELTGCVRHHEGRGLCPRKDGVTEKTTHCSFLSLQRTGEVTYSCPRQENPLPWCMRRHRYRANCWRKEFPYPVSHPLISASVQALQIRSPQTTTVHPKPHMCGLLKVFSGAVSGTSLCSLLKN